jgi:hypothetical protein
LSLAASSSAADDHGAVPARAPSSAAGAALLARSGNVNGRAGGDGYIVADDDSNRPRTYADDEIPRCDVQVPGDEKHSHAVLHACIDRRAVERSWVAVVSSDLQGVRVDGDDRRPRVCSKQRRGADGQK